MSSFRYVKNTDQQTIETICMDVDELLYFLQNVQNVKQFCCIYSYDKKQKFVFSLAKNPSLYIKTIKT
jgi:hypothetical protein